MSHPSKHDTEDRLRRALTARAEQVTPASLRPAEPPQPARPRLITWGVPILAAAAVAAAVGVMVSSGLGPEDTAPPAGQPSTQVTSGTCAGEAALITQALDTGGVPADVDGDGATDRVATASDDDAAPRCRAFVGVRTADGATYSTVLEPPAVPPLGMDADVIALPDLGMDGRADIVVDTHLMADGALAQLFTWTEDGLVRVPVPASEEGNFTVAGGGFTSPQAAGCTADGSLVISMANATRQGAVYEITRHEYPVIDSPLEFGSPAMGNDEVPAGQLARELPDFAPCTP